MADEPIDQRIERALKSPEDYVDNQDFSRRVMDALPRKRRFTPMSRRLVIAGSALVGLTLSCLLMPSRESLAIIDVVTDNVWYLTAATVAFAMGVVLGGGWLASARIVGFRNLRSLSRLVWIR